MRRTRILATIGPASVEPEVLRQMMSAGLDAVRLNFSHGSREWHAEAYRRVREAAVEAGREVAILQDLQGPKIRLGKVKGSMTVLPGSSLVITTRDLEGEGGIVSTDYLGLPGDVKPGMTLLLDEGRVTVVVRHVDGMDVSCEVVDGGVLSSDKGLNVPGSALTTAAMTERDREDVRFGLDLGVDYVALSFVRRASDVLDLHDLMHRHGRRVPVIAKIEKPQAVEAIDEIVAVADGVMVARGDLAIEASLDRIPAHQKKIIERANRAGKLVITATQMLESMTENSLPTRAEVTDVANAILDGTDAVMLSGETAMGKHPVASVQRMASIALATEEDLYPWGRPIRPVPLASEGLGRVASRMAAQGAREADARAIVVFTNSGEMAARLSDERPQAPIVAFSRAAATLRRLALYWGVHALSAPHLDSASGLMEHAARVLRERRWAERGDTVVFVLGAQVAPGGDYSVRLVKIG